MKLSAIIINCSGRGILIRFLYKMLQKKLPHLDVCKEIMRDWNIMKNVYMYVQLFLNVHEKTYELRAPVKILYMGPVVIVMVKCI